MYGRWSKYQYFPVKFLNEAIHQYMISPIRKCTNYVAIWYLAGHSKQQDLALPAS